MSHRLLINVSLGQNASLYLPICECGWIGGDCRSEEQARAEYAEHAAGKVPPWEMRAGDSPGWER